MVCPRDGEALEFLQRQMQKLVLSVGQQLFQEDIQDVRKSVDRYLQAEDGSFGNLDAQAAVATTELEPLNHHLRLTTSDRFRGSRQTGFGSCMMPRDIA